LVYLIQSDVDQKPREKTTGVFEGYAGDMLTGQVEKIFAFAFKEQLTVHFPNAPERLPRVQSCRLSPDGTKMLINMDTNAPYIHTSYLVQCENFKPVKVLHAFRKRHFDWLNDQIVIGEDVPIALRISDQKFCGGCHPMLRWRQFVPPADVMLLPENTRTLRLSCQTLSFCLTQNRGVLLVILKTRRKRRCLGTDLLFHRTEPD
jgi:hypothetical protein